MERKKRMRKLCLQLLSLLLPLLLLLSNIHAGQAQPLAVAYSPGLRSGLTAAPAGDDLWDPRFGFQGIGNGQPYAAVADGADLFVGGSFTTVSQLPANNIARWDGQRWHALGDGVNGYVYALAVSGDTVYVGGSFTLAGDQTVTNLAQWNRQTETWAPVGNGQGPRQDSYPAEIYALVVVDDLLYAGGARFTQIDGVASNALAAYDPATQRWQALAGGVATCYSDDCSSLSAATVRAISAGPDGKLYVGGDFNYAANEEAFVPVYGVAAWDPTMAAWSALGSGLADDEIGNYYGTALSFTVSGTDLYVGGQFKTAGGLAANSIARWSTKQAEWHALAAGFVTQYGSLARVPALAVVNETLYAGGDFDGAGTLTVKRLAQYDLGAETWAPVATGLEEGATVSALASTPDGTLFVAGDFDYAGSVAANRIAKWTGDEWQALGLGVQWSSIPGQIAAAAVAADGRVYVGGYFTNIGGQPFTNVAVWDGEQWSALGDGLGTSSDEIYAVAIHGDEVYFGGKFSKAGAISANNIARWNTTSAEWRALGSGIPSGGQVNALAFDQDGVLYVGGDFDAAGNVPAEDVARWDPQQNQWATLGAGIDFAYGAVYALAVDSSGVFIGGDFDSIVVGEAEQPVNGLVYWDRAADELSYFGTGLTKMGYSDRVSGTVLALALTDDGQELYIGGEFDQAGDNAANHVAVLTTEGWAALGDSVGGTDAKVQALYTAGDAVYIGGFFEVAGTVTANNLGKWDRSAQQWESLGSGIALADYDDGVLALAGVDDVLYVGGRFLAAGGQPSAGFAIWGVPPVAKPLAAPAVDAEPAAPVILVADDFSTADQWQFSGLPTGVKAKIAKGGLQIDLAKNKNLTLIAPGDPAADVVVTIDVQFPKGATGDSIGLGCRLQENGDGYWFLMSRNGYYRIEKQRDGDLQPLVDWTTSAAINTTAGASNNVQIRCTGSALALFVNEVEVAQVEDEEIQGAGSIQLFAASTLKASKGTQVLFDNLSIASP